MNLGSLRAFVDKSLELHERGCQDSRTTALDIVHAIVEEGDLSALSYFLEVSPKEVVKAGAERMTRLKEDTDFLIPGFFFGPRTLTDGELQARALERKPLYDKIHEVLKREAAYQ